MAASPDIDCQTELREESRYGPVLRIALSGSESHEIVTHSRKVMEEAVNLHRPRLIVVDLLGFSPLIGANTVNFLASAVVATRKLGDDRKIRVLASGKTAVEVERIFAITGLNEFYDGKVFPDIQSALNA